MMRLILVLILLFLVFWMGKSIIRDFQRMRQARRSDEPSKASSPAPPVSDKLVRDPVCGVYCPKRTAHTVLWKGKVYYFCSEKCRQKFLSTLSSSSSE